MVSNTLWRFPEASLLGSALAHNGRRKRSFNWGKDGCVSSEGCWVSVDTGQPGASAWGGPCSQERDRRIVRRGRRPAHTSLACALPQRKRQTPLTDSEATASDDAYHDRSPCARVIGDFTETLRGSYAASITGEETRTRTSKHSGHEPRRPLAREGYASRAKLQRPADNALSCRHECYTLRGACPRRHLPHERHTLCGARPRRATPATFLGVTRPHPPCTGLRRVVRIASKDRSSCLPASLQ